MPWIPATCFLPGFWLERVPAPLSQTYPSGLGLCIFEVPELNFHFLFFNNRYVCVCVCVRARARVCVGCSVMSNSGTPWTPPGSSVHRILQAKLLEWVAIPFSRDLPNPRIKPKSPTLQADSVYNLSYQGGPTATLICSFFIHFILGCPRSSC